MGSRKHDGKTSVLQWYQYFFSVDSQAQLYFVF